MMRIAIGAALGVLLTGGCMPLEDQEVPARDDTGFTCNAAPVQRMVGQVASQQLGGEAVRAAKARVMRWIAPNTAVTMDYRTDRLNIHVDSNNRITRIDCG